MIPLFCIGRNWPYPPGDWSYWDRAHICHHTGHKICSCHFLGGQRSLCFYCWNSGIQKEIFLARRRSIRTNIPVDFHWSRKGQSAGSILCHSTPRPSSLFHLNLNASQRIRSVVIFMKLLIENELMIEISGDCICEFGFNLIRSLFANAQSS